MSTASYGSRLNDAAAGWIIVAGTLRVPSAELQIGSQFRGRHTECACYFRQKPENWCIAGAAHVGFAVSIRVRDNTPSSPSPS